MSLPSIHANELANLKAWPALETSHDGSWVLRAAGGYTKRANSVQSFDAADDADVPERLAFATRWYEARRLPMVFRVTPQAGERLLKVLGSGEWEAFERSNTLAMTLDGTTFGIDARVVFYPPTAPEWLAAQRDLQGYDDATTEGLRALVAGIAVPAQGIIVRSDSGLPAASAIMIVADGIAYAGNVVVSKSERRRGYGRTLMQSGLAWSAEAGATTAAINVVAKNEPAVRLYAGLGYLHRYDYHYCRRVVA